MAWTQNNVLIAAESRRAARWEIYRRDQRLEVFEAPVTFDSKDLCSFAESLSARFGGPFIRAVVFVSDRSPADQVEAQPIILARYPRLVCWMSRGQALAHSAAPEWSRFLVVEQSNELSCSLFCRTREGFLVEQKLAAGCADDLISVVRVVGIRYCLLSSGGEGQSSLLEGELASVLETQVAQPDAAIAGASSYASALMQSQGVSVEKRRRSSVRAFRTIEYSVLHPSRPVFDPEESTLAEVAGSRAVLLVADAELNALYGRSWRKYAQCHLNLSAELLLDVSEHSKVWDQVYDICALAGRCGLPRDGIILGLGGGVMLDIAGLAASVFRRGVDYIRVPTTLVGLVDVAVGIKQGVNALGKKNIIGTFYPPLASINDYRFAQTLHRREIACGMAEIAKISLLRDPVLLELLESYGRELSCSRFGSPAEIAAEVANRAELLMMEELAPNLFERNLARLVDFGHTFSPSIETLSRFEIPHGYAVGLDMLISTALAVGRGIAEGQLLTRLASLLGELGLPVWDDRIPEARVLSSALEDVRRHRAGALNLVVIVRPGSTEFLQSVSTDELEAALTVLRARASTQGTATLDDLEREHCERAAV